MLQFQRPDEEKIAQVAQDTKAALEKIVNGKVAAAKPTHVAAQNNSVQFVRSARFLSTLYLVS